MTSKLKTNSITSHLLRIQQVDLFGYGSGVLGGLCSLRLLLLARRGHDRKISQTVCHLVLLLLVVDDRLEQRVVRTQIVLDTVYDSNNTSCLSFPQVAESAGSALS